MLQQFDVFADPSKLAGYGLTLHDLEAALANNNANFGAGYVEDRGERLTVRGIGRVTNAADIATVVVATRGATPVYVRDVARVDVGPQPRFGAVTRDGRGEAVSAAVIILKGSNGPGVLKRVQGRLAEIDAVLPAGVRIRPFYSQGEVVRRTTRTMFTNLTEGALLVIAILFLFLRNLRASLLTASVIPLSLLFAFLAMKRFGLTANLMSLGALDFGLIVDASVVMVENFVRRRAIALGHRATRRASCGGVRGGATDRIRDRDHCRGLHPDLRASRAGRPHVQTDGVHGLCGGLRVAALGTEPCTCRRIVPVRARRRVFQRAR